MNETAKGVVKSRAGMTDCGGVHPGRREVIRLLAGVGLGATAMSALPGAHAQAPSPAPPADGPPLGPPPGDLRATVFNATLTQITPTVYAFLQIQAPGQMGRSLANCGLIVGPTSMLAIDTTSAPLQAQHFIATAKKATGKPFRRIVLTHHHFDHTFGLQFFGDVEVIAQEQCRVKILESVTEGPVKNLWSRHPGWADGTEQFHKVLPTVTYKEEMALYDYGDTEVRLLHFGPGHTVGDTVVYLPREKIVFAGDIAFFSMTPLNGSGYIADWIKRCDDILAMDVDKIVPGHGPIGGKKDLSEVRDYLQLLYTQARRLYDAGIPAAQAGKMIDLGKFAAWPESDRTFVNVMRLYSEFNGTIKP